MTHRNRTLTYLTHEEVRTRILLDSVLCLPVGSTEQHGPHLPLNTDTILATRFAERLVAEFSARYDLWLLPAFELGLSCEHQWAAGTLSLSIELFVKLLHELVQRLVDCQGSRNILIVNGHGGNRGVLESLILEFRWKYAVAAVVLHPSALARVASESGAVEVHAGKSETSLMLALAPEVVRTDCLPGVLTRREQESAAGRILDRGASWPWYSNDPGLGREGVIGDASSSSVELGNTILRSALRNSEAVIRELIEFGKVLRARK